MKYMQMCERGIKHIVELVVSNRNLHVDTAANDR